MQVVKLAALVFGVVFTAAAAGLVVAMFRLVADTKEDPRLRDCAFRWRAATEAAVRGAWPTLPSARWYRRCLWTLLCAWLGGLCSVALHEVLGA